MEREIVVKYVVNEKLYEKLEQITDKMHKKKGSNTSPEALFNNIMNFAGDKSMERQMAIFELYQGLLDDKCYSSSDSAIRKLREQTGLTQQQFGDFLGISRRTIQNWESHTRACSHYLVDLIKYKLWNEGLLPEEN